MSELEMQNLAIWCNRCLGALTKFVILWKKSSKFQSTGQISRPFVPPGSHPASHDVSCRFVVSSQHFKFSSSYDPNLPEPNLFNGPGSAKPIAAGRGSDKLA